MTKKHYLKLAAIVAEMRSTDKHKEAGLWLAIKLGEMIAADNPRFSPLKFLTACGLSRAEMAWAWPGDLQ